MILNTELRCPHQQAKLLENLVEGREQKTAALRKFYSTFFSNSMINRDVSPETTCLSLNSYVFWLRCLDTVELDLRFSFCACAEYRAVFFFFVFLFFFANDSLAKICCTWSHVALSDVNDFFFPCFFLTVKSMCGSPYAASVTSLSLSARSCTGDSALLQQLTLEFWSEMFYVYCLKHEIHNIIIYIDRSRELCWEIHICRLK